MDSRAVALAIGLAVAAGIVRGAESPALPQGGIAAALGDAAASGRDARRRATTAVPLERMAEPHRRIAAESLRAATLFRRLPTEVVTCDPALLDFVIAKPEVMVDLWRTLGISRLALDPTGPGQWRLSDGYGTEGVVTLLHRERTDRGGLLVFHGRGGYTGPLAPKRLTGSCLVVLRHAAADPDGLGRPRQAVQIDAFLDVDGLGLELVTRTLQPLIVHSAATNFHEISLFVTQFAAAAARNPAAVSRMADRMTRTTPEDRRRLVALAAGTAPPRPSMAAGDDVHAELAARWMTAEQLDALQHR